MTNIQNKLIGGRWAITTAGFQSLQLNLHRLQHLRYGGLKGLIYGNPIKLQSQEINHIEPVKQVGDIALINVNGILMKGVSAEEADLLGVVNTDVISQTLDELALDDTVQSIILNFATPGGETTGIDILGRKIKNIDQHIKPIYAWTETQCASAGYWLASQCRVVGMTSSAEVGSVGVYVLINDETAKLEKEGIKINAIFSGSKKLIGHEFRVLSPEEQSILQADVNNKHQQFKDVITASRPDVKPEALDGLSYEGTKAFELGLVDIVCDSIEAYVQELVV